MLICTSDPRCFVANERKNPESPKEIRHLLEQQEKAQIILDNAFHYVQEMGFYVTGEGSKLKGEFVITKLTPKVTNDL